MRAGNRSYAIGGSAVPDTKGGHIAVDISHVAFKVDDRVAVELDSAVDGTDAGAARADHGDFGVTVNDGCAVVVTDGVGFFGSSVVRKVGVAVDGDNAVNCRSACPDAVASVIAVIFKIDVIGVNDYVLIVISKVDACHFVIFCALPAGGIQSQRHSVPCLVYQQAGAVVMQLDGVSMGIRIVVISAYFNITVAVENNRPVGLDTEGTAVSACLVIGVVDDFDRTCDTAAACDLN